MATAQELLNIVLAQMVDPDGDLFIELSDLGVAEQLSYVNDCLYDISHRIARWKQRSFGRSKATLDIAPPAYSATLPTGFLCLAHDQYKRPKVFNVSEDHSRMAMAQESTIDGWEDEKSTDTGTPTIFYFMGDNKLCVHPRPDVAMQVKLYYFAEESIAALGEDIPWGGAFDKSVQLYLLLALRERMEQTGLIPVGARRFASRLAKDMKRAYGERGFSLRPAVGQGFGR